MEHFLICVVIIAIVRLPISEQVIANNCEPIIYGSFNNTSNVEEYTIRNVFLNLYYEHNCSEIETFEYWNVYAHVTSGNEDILKIFNSSRIYSSSDIENISIPFEVQGIFLGYADVKVRVNHSFGNENVLANETEFSYKFGVQRKEQVWMIFFTVFMATFAAINYINMGVQLDLEMVKTVLKRPIGPTIGFISQFTVMPLAAFGYGYLFLEDQMNMRLGLFMLGCSPGGSSSNFWTLMLGGDLNLSITMTFISALAALGMMPLWIFTLGKQLFQDNKIALPYENLVISLITLTAPLLIGILVKYKLPRIAAFSRKVIRPMTIFVILVGMSVSFATNYYIFFLFSWRILAASFSVCFSGYLIGGVLGWLGRLEWKQIVTVSIETAFQNASIPFVVLSVSLGQPERDLVVIPIVAQIMFTGLPLWFVFCGLKARDKIYGKKADEYNLEMTKPNDKTDSKENILEKYASPEKS